MPFIVTKKSYIFNSAKHRLYIIVEVYYNTKIYSILQTILRSFHCVPLFGFFVILPLNLFVN